MKAATALIRKGCAQVGIEVIHLARSASPPPLNACDLGIVMNPDHSIVNRCNGDLKKSCHGIRSVSRSLSKVTRTGTDNYGRGFVK